METLQQLQDNWNNYQVFCISAPTAFGKTAIARAIMNACYGVSVITPTNLLVDQFISEFPDTPTLHRLDSYWCDRWDRPASVTRGKLGGFCKKADDCPGCHTASRDIAIAKYQRGPGVYNYYTYMAHKLHRPVLVVDEAHNLLPVIRDRLSLIIWQHDYKYPSNMYSNSQVQNWLSTLPDSKKRSQKIQLLRQAAISRNPQYVIQRDTEWFNGKGTIRGQPEKRDCIRLLPVDVRDAPPMFWPNDVQKIVLMSATIGPKDLAQIGLDPSTHKKKTIYLDCKSPIDSSRRPIVPICSMSVNRASLTDVNQIQAMADEILAVANYHQEDGKGVIHATYQLAQLLRSHLSHDIRFMFHSRDDKSDVYKKFRESAPSEAKILVASGMYEGIDLPEDLGRWQVIAKIPWPSLGSPAIQHQAEKDPDWYTWETLKTTIQACGRICRTPEDYGVTYILDQSFERLMRDGHHMMPQWFLDGITK